MDLRAFKESLDDTMPPPDLSLALQALWQEAKGDWETAHQLAQSENNPSGAWVHAYLHRKEGDTSNAAYWYSRAGQKMPNSSLEEEWEEIAKALLSS